MLKDLAHWPRLSLETRHETHAPQQSPILFDHFIGMSEQSLRDVRSKALAAVRFLRPAWSRLFYNPLKSEKYSGGREQVRGFLLQDLALAAKIAGDMM
jgi:hypothetical protein